MQSQCHFKNIEYHLTQALKGAKSRILIAVAWFTNPVLASTLIGRPELSIEIICDENPINSQSQAIQICRQAGIEVTLIKDLNKSVMLMHHKFCVIDNQTLITGSYNWTKNANRNNENIVIVQESHMAVLYIQEFRLLKEMRNPRKTIFIEPEELDPIAEELHQQLVRLLKKSFDQGKLHHGILSSYNNSRLINKLRALHESLANTMRANAPSLLVYLRLIEKHGAFYRSRSTVDELHAEESRYESSSVRNLDHDVEHTFSKMKVEAIRKIQWVYMKMLRAEQSEEDELKIFKMVDYLIKEVKPLI